MIQDESVRRDFRALCKFAGVPKEDITDDPEHGLMIPVTSVHRLTSALMFFRERPPTGDQ